MKVLAALDFGEASLEALKQARTLAHQLGATLGVCHVLPPDHDLAALFPAAAEAQADPGELGRVRQSLLDHARDKLGLELSEVFVERGAPYAQIVQRADAWKADFLVVGSHGRSGLSRVLLGSVAERVVRHAHCSVLVARHAPESGPVLAATDLSEQSLPAIPRPGPPRRAATAASWWWSLPSNGAGLPRLP
ncbi:MAG: universal stress protein [Polyangiaceae bacterium]